MRDTIVSSLGSPPRARGAAVAELAANPSPGITPACAGSRPDPRRERRRGRDHPRVRGEQLQLPLRPGRPWGSPPRARGAGSVQQDQVLRLGITPACAGSRWTHDAVWCSRWDHPRVRGEQGERAVLARSNWGSPPRARGADSASSASTCHCGITPACAGSRPPPDRGAPPRSDHPRVRGEQGAILFNLVRAAGSPPRARGAGGSCRRCARRPGITPACAGSRVVSPTRSTSRWDHPRVRGEQSVCGSAWSRSGGSPPRARGAGQRPARPRPEGRITPACAGSSVHAHGVEVGRRDHPRVRGEQEPGQINFRVSGGSPPRARGAGHPRRRQRGQQRITPACAGSRCSRRRPAVLRGDHPRVRGEQTS